jgi:calcium/calmodulin-dependent protein kinase I
VSEGGWAGSAGARARNSLSPGLVHTRIMSRFFRCVGAWGEGGEGARGGRVRGAEARWCGAGRWRRARGRAAEEGGVWCGARRKDRVRDPCREEYEFKEELGSGSFATVYRAVCKRDGTVWAIKMIDKAKLETREDVEALETEVEILERLEHPNVVKLRQVFDTPSCFYMVMEMLTGGELFDRIVEKERYTEGEARATVRKVADALRYCHARGVVHRDLKPENLLYQSKADDAEIKIADFGLGKLLPDADMTMITACGTPGYVAPEILQSERYTAKVDMWSLGIITYIVLSGYPPFYHENTAVLFELIKSGRFEFHADYWGSVSPAAKDFISKLLVVSPRDRMSAEDALAHPWLAAASAAAPAAGDVHLSAAQAELRKYLIRRKFRAKVLAAQAVSRLRKFAGAGDALEDRFRAIGLDKDPADAAADAPAVPGPFRAAPGAAPGAAAAGGGGGAARKK